MASTREQLLSCLKRERGNWVSGEALSETLSVSRNAIWKHVGKLREEGYRIESYPKKGYLLEEPPDLFLPGEIRESLPNGLFGKGTIVYDREMTSTNTRAKELAAQGAAEGAIVVAEMQTGGRGRRGRTWFSPEGLGIYASLILRPNMSPGETPRITLMTSVALAEALMEMTTLAVNIRWPNDIFINGKKVAGILTEISTEMDGVDYIVVGVGINVNTPHADFPEDLRDKATSLFVETGKVYPRLPLFRDFLVRFEKYYRMFVRGDFQPIMGRWKSLSDIIGRQVTVEAIDKKVTGRVVDVNDEGVLIVVDALGESYRVFSGDVILSD